MAAWARKKRAVDVHAHHLAVGALLDVGEVLGPGDPGDVAEHVEAAELVDARRRPRRGTRPRR